MDEEGLVTRIAELDESAVDLARELLGRGTPPERVMDLLRRGMDIVGDRYEKGEYFISELVVAGEIGEAIASLLEPYFRESADKRERVVLGTIEGDIHSIGKNLVKMVLLSTGFDVVDLGVDVKADVFVKAVMEHSARVVGVSAFLTTTALNIRKVVDALKAAGIRDRVVLMVGGAAVTEEFARSIGADIYAMSAVEAARKLREALGP